MIDKTEHPIKEHRLNQKRFLDQLPENAREEHAFLFRVGNLSYRYYMDLEAQPDEDDYSDWLEGLPPNIARDMREKGFEACRTILSLRRHAAERNDFGLIEYLREYLSESEFRRWQNLSEK